VKSLKATLIKSATTAIQYDPQLKKYYDRKTKEGKHKMSVKNAVANKIVSRIFAVVKRNEPFVKLVA
jgi:transposase